jgi:hypothetical protein
MIAENPPPPAPHGKRNIVGLREDHPMTRSLRLSLVLAIVLAAPGPAAVAAPAER